MKVLKLLLCCALIVLVIPYMAPCMAKSASNSHLPKIGTRVDGAEDWETLKNGDLVVVAEVSLIVSGKPQHVKYKTVATDRNHLDRLTTNLNRGRVRASVAFNTRLVIGVRGKVVPESFRLKRYRAGKDAYSCEIKFVQVIDGEKIRTKVELAGFSEYTDVVHNSNATQWRKTVLWLNAPTGSVEWTKLSPYEEKKVRQKDR